VACGVFVHEQSTLKLNADEAQVVPCTLATTV
jgi:hypothetical protein